MFPQGIAGASAGCLGNWHTQPGKLVKWYTGSPNYHFWGVWFWRLKE